MNKEELFKQITDQMNDLCTKKNADYGDSVHRTYLDYGLVSFLVRIEDKLNRLKTLSKQERKVNDEKIEDTLIDLANYSVLALVELKAKGDTVE